MSWRIFAIAVGRNHAFNIAGKAESNVPQRFSFPGSHTGGCGQLRGFFGLHKFKRIADCVRVRLSNQSELTRHGAKWTHSRQTQHARPALVHSGLQGGKLRHGVCPGKLTRAFDDTAKRPGVFRNGIFSCQKPSHEPDGGV